MRSASNVDVETFVRENAGRRMRSGTGKWAKHPTCNGRIIGWCPAYRYKPSGPYTDGGRRMILDGSKPKAENLPARVIVEQDFGGWEIKNGQLDWAGDAPPIRETILVKEARHGWPLRLNEIVWVDSEPAFTPEDFARKHAGRRVRFGYSSIAVGRIVGWVADDYEIGVEPEDRDPYPFRNKKKERYVVKGVKDFHATPISEIEFIDDLAKPSNAALKAAKEWLEQPDPLYGKAKLEELARRLDAFASLRR